jgi:hypothetical protein
MIAFIRAVRNDFAHDKILCRVAPTSSEASKSQAVMASLALIYIGFSAFRNESE